MNSFITETDREIEFNPKTLLKKNNKFTVGDIVSIDDENPIYAHVIKEIEGDSITIIGIELSEEKDDIIEYEMTIDKSELLLLGDSFININGALWKIKERVLKENK